MFENSVTLTAQRCAYCDAPLPAARGQDPQPREGQREVYCCYGCRFLGQSGQRPLTLLSNNVSSWFKIAVGAFLAGQAMLLDLAINQDPPEGATRGLLHLALIGSSLGVSALLGRPLIQSLIESIRSRKITIEQLFVLGITGAFLASLYSTFTGAGAVYYEVIAVLLTVYAIGKTLGAESRARALAESQRLKTTFELCTVVLPDGSHSRVTADRIRIGDRILVRAGEPVPIDGDIVQGQAFIRETPITGEPYPVVRRPGDTVLAGSYTEDGALVVAARVPGVERQLDYLLGILAQARELPARAQTQADRMVQWFLPTVVTVAMGTFVYWTYRSGFGVGLFNSMAVLLVACPCAMGLATPLALWNAIAVMASRGLVVRSSKALDYLARLDHLIFDKTGTLSEDSLSLIDLATTGGVRERQRLLTTLKAIQSQSQHPVARAFHAWAGFNSLPGGNRVAPVDDGQPPGACPERTLGVTIKSIKTVPAAGIEAWVVQGTGEEQHWRIGQREFMHSLENEANLQQGLRFFPEDHLIYVESDGRLQAIAAVRERLRESAPQTIASAHTLGLRCSVLTGDHAARAAQLGLKEVEGRLTPQAKADRIQALRHQGEHVGYVGDGINDAPAIRAADVGIALAHGAGVSTANADAVLFGGDLRTLLWAIALCRQVQSSLRSNLGFAAAYNAAGLFLAATGMLHPVTAALLMVLSSFTVSWRALRSTNSSGLCCLDLPAQPNPGAPPTRFMAHGQVQKEPAPSPEAKGGATHPLGADRVNRRKTYALLLVLQWPFLCYLGQLDWPTRLWLAGILVASGIWLSKRRARNPEQQHWLDMTTAMLGPGNWGMILGWWADLGFQPYTGIACCSGQSFSLLGFLQMPWMNAGMLLLGLPPMLALAAFARGWDRLSLAWLSSAGMVWGMAYGNFLALQWLNPPSPQRFLVSFAGMTVGMLAGMFFACELGRALTLWRRRQPPQRG